MKRISILFLFLFSAHFILAQNIMLEWAEPGTTNYSNTNLSICGESKNATLKASFSNDPLCPYSGWGANRYRYTINLFKDNVLISTRSFQASSCSANEFYNNFTLTEGVYKVNIILEVRGSWWRWRQRRNGTSSLLIVNRTPATPAFTINGIVPIPDEPIEVCPEQIIIDPSSTSCEDDYYVGIWEFDYLNWNRPLQYEWGKWFEGQAPASINLQQLSAQYSFGNDFLGSVSSRQGEILYGGNLPNNNPRYYHVSICTGYPSWNCASAVIKVKCSCP